MFLRVALGGSDAVHPTHSLASPEPSPRCLAPGRRASSADLFPNGLLFGRQPILIVTQRQATRSMRVQVLGAIGLGQRSHGEDANARLTH
jgi:hypothetical protein